MTGLLLALALASPGFAGVVTVDAGATTATEGRAPTSVGTRLGARLGFLGRGGGDGIDFMFELRGGWVAFPTDEDRWSASGFDAGSGVRLGVEMAGLRPEVFTHLGVDVLYRTQADGFDDQGGRGRRAITREHADLGIDAGLGLTYLGIPHVGVGLFGMWQTTLALDDRRERLTAGLHLDVYL